MVKNIFILFATFVFSVLSAQKTHTVQPKETAYGISRQYGLTIDELYQLNPSKKDGKLNIGDVLIISKAGNPAPKSTPTATSGNKNGTTGTIILQPKQTIYGITKQYQISEADLRKLNPDLDSHMKIGDKVILPLKNIEKYGNTTPAITTPPTETKNITQTTETNPNIQKTVSEPVKNEPENSSNSSETNSSQDDYVTYTVQSGDTMFGIMNKFGVTLDELLDLNPNLSNGLKAGMILKIKKSDPIYSKKSGDILSIVLMLPFGFDANDAKFRTISMDFLTGAKLAAERNAKSGQKLDFKVVDAGNETTFKNSLSQINQDNTDLIIGPFFKTNVLEVLNYVKGKKIPVVAPFANSSDLFDYNNLIIIETDNSVYSDRIVKEVSQVYQDQKIYIVADNSRANASAIKSGLEKSLTKPNIEMVNSSADIQTDTNMMTGQPTPIIAILADDDESAGNAFASKLIDLSKQTDGIKAFSMFYNPSFEKNVDELSKVNLVYLVDRKINYDGSFEKEILAAYKAKYCKSPSKYAVIGFDVMNDMLTRENKKGEIFKQIEKPQTQLATKFEFVKAKPNGAYINNGYRVVRLMQ